MFARQVALSAVVESSRAEERFRVGTTRREMEPSAVPTRPAVREALGCCKIGGSASVGSLRCQTSRLSAVTDDSVAPEAEQEPLDLTPDEVDEIEQAESEAEPISYSGTDFDAEGLVRRLERGDIVIPSFGRNDQSLEVSPFQRGFVWRRSQMDRFIESLLLGFPIPGIMLVEQTDKRYLVLDGQQRLRTLAAFYKGIYQGQEFALQNVAEEFQGLTYETLTTTQRRTLDNTFIQATIVRSDGSSGSLESVYQVFERLNSGGTQLTAHEIRIALYPGQFVSLLDELNGATGWREINGARSLRLRDQELVLRILALYSRAGEYQKPMKSFLNKFLRDHRDLHNFPVEELKSLFLKATDALSSAGARSILRRQGARINSALLEAVVIGCMRRASYGGSLERESVVRGLRKVISDEDLVRAAGSRTTDDENVRLRLTNATRAFAES